jgi:RsiW-degrading membrane proteinase PrsW (M82 family)/RNA polymerase subunit RPABC4/transcription elongation factor Spt4
VALAVGLLAGALAPSVFLLHFFYVRDKYDREPLRRLLKVFFISFLSVIPAVALELATDPLLSSSLQGFLVGLIEESVKFAFFWWLVSRLPDFDEPYDGILYAVAISLGFATVENVLYVLGTGSVAIVAIRALFSVPGHCLWGVVMGYYLGKWRFETDAKVRRGLVLKALLWPAFLHGFFDFALFGAEEIHWVTLFGAPIEVIALWVVCMKMVHRAQAASPFKRPSIMESPIAALDMRYKYCQRCGAKSLRDDRFCPKCGLPHPEPSSPPQHNIAFCDQCGAGVMQDDHFCPKCGATQPDRALASAVYRDCPVCKARALKDDRFCPQCGTPLNAVVA